MDKIKILLQNVEEGDAEASFALANAFKEGIDVPANAVKSAYYYMLAADMGLRKADLKLGFCYENGFGVGTNETRAKEYYLRAANAGYPEGFTAVGSIFEREYDRIHNTDAEKSRKVFEAAIENFEKAIRQGDKSAALRLGRMLYLEPNPELKKRARKYLSVAVENGVAEAYYYIGMCELNREKPDAAAAARYFSIGAEKENTLSMLAYADCLFFGKGVKSNRERAFRMAKGAEQLGQFGAAYLLAVCYFEGIGCEQDTQLGKKYLNAALSYNDPKALFLIGALYEHGKHGYAQNIEKAAAYFKKAAQFGDDDAKAMYGKMLILGIGELSDYKKAYEYILESAENGSPIGKYYLAYCFEKGFGTEIDFKRAKELYKEISEVGILDASERYLAISERLK